MKGIFHLSVALLLVACSTDKSDHENAHPGSQAQTNILNLAVIYSDAEKIISFPVLFNDSMIELRDISSIERIAYYGSEDSTDFETTPERKTTYTFDKNGLVKEMMIGNYYDNRLISTIQATYSNHQPETGFATVKLNESLRTEDFPYYEFKQIRRTKQLISFENTSSYNNLFVVPNAKHWKPLVIDTLCHPSKDDLIVWGSPKYPEKIYQVTNLVNESNVREFNYEKGVLKSIDWTDDPFKIHRTFQFNKDGVCRGFVDSTFSMGGFVATSVFEFELKDNLPVSITKKLISGDNKRIIFKETFHYKYGE